MRSTVRQLGPALALIAAAPFLAVPLAGAPAQASGEGGGPETPKAELLTDAPAAETPSTETPSTETPSTETPAEVSPRATNTPPMIAREGSVTSPVKPSIDPARDIRSASFRVETRTGRARATVTLGAVPIADTDSDLWLAFGEKDAAGTCQTTSDDSWSMATYDPGRTSATIGISVQYNYGWQDLNCAFAVTMPSGSPNPSPGDEYDSAGTDLRNVFATPVGRLRAQIHEDDYATYAKRWTPLRVIVRNPGTGPVRDVRVAIGGAGVTSRKVVRLGALAAGKRKVARVQVRVKGGKRIKGGLRQRQLRVTVSGRGPAAIRQQSSVATMVLPRGTKPRPGAYRGNRVAFRVTRAGRVKDFSIRQTAVCAGGVNFSDTMRLPTTKVNRFGWIARPYTLGNKKVRRHHHLRMRFKGNRVTHGFHSYRGPGGCRGDRTFKAKRVGR